jgi:hypothetical protein
VLYSLKERRALELSLSLSLASLSFVLIVDQAMVSGFCGRASIDQCSVYDGGGVGLSNSR